MASVGAGVGAGAVVGMVDDGESVALVVVPGLPASWSSPAVLALSSRTVKAPIAAAVPIAAAPAVSAQGRRVAGVRWARAPGLDLGQAVGRLDLVRLLGQRPADQIVERVVRVVVHRFCSRSWRSDLARPRGVALHGSPADPHRVGDLRLGQVAVVPQHHHGALFLRQGPHRLDHPVGLDRPQHGLFRARLVRERAGRVLVHHHQVALPGAAAVHHRGPEVGERLVRVAQPVPAAVHCDERVLHDLLRRAGVTQQQGAEADQRRVVRRVDSRQRLVGIPRGLVCHVLFVHHRRLRHGTMTRRPRPRLTTATPDHGLGVFRGNYE